MTSARAARARLWAEAYFSTLGKYCNKHTICARRPYTTLLGRRARTSVTTVGRTTGIYIPTIDVINIHRRLQWVCAASGTKAATRRITAPSPHAPVVPACAPQMAFATWMRSRQRSQGLSPAKHRGNWGKRCGFSPHCAQKTAPREAACAPVPPADWFGTFQERVIGTPAFARALWVAQRRSARFT
jgi:hypothetical protein